MMSGTRAAPVVLQTRCLFIRASMASVKCPFAMRWLSTPSTTTPTFGNHRPDVFARRCSSAVVLRALVRKVFSVADEVIVRFRLKILISSFLMRGRVRLRVGEPSSTAPRPPPVVPLSTTASIPHRVPIVVRPPHPPVAPGHAYLAVLAMPRICSRSPPNADQPRMYRGDMSTPAPCSARSARGSSVPPPPPAVVVGLVPASPRAPLQRRLRRSYCCGRAVE